MSKQRARWRPRLRSSSSRLAATFVVVFAIAMSALLFSLYVWTARVLDREVETLIRSEVESLADEYARGGVLQLVSALHRRSDNWGRTGMVYLLMDTNGYTIAGNLEDWPYDAVTTDSGIEFEIETAAGAVHPIRAHVFQLPAERQLLVGTEISERRQLARRLRTLMAWTIGASIVLATLLGGGYSRRVRKRVAQIAATCRTIMQGELSRRLPLDGTRDEFDELSIAVNRMLDRIEQQTQLLQTTFDSAAHDLRAPLYRARVRIEEALQHEDLGAAPRETMEATIAELDRVQRTLGTLLQIAQASALTRDIATDVVDMAALAEELVDLYQPEAAARAQQLRFVREAGSGGARIRGNRQLLAQLIVNLLENALKYVPSGGAITVRVTSDAAHVGLLVADNGPGIPAQERTTVLQPFARLERDRQTSGSGLGLSLVAAVVQLHGGTLELEDNEPGLVVRCGWPREVAE